MVTIIIRDGKKKYKRKVPTSFSELNRIQYFHFVQILFLEEKFPTLDNLPISFKIHLFKKLLNVPDKVFFKIGYPGILSFLDKVSGVFKPDNHPAIKRILVGFKLLHLPKEDISDLSFMEFCMAETFYQSILDQEGNETKNLNWLTAILCKPHHLVGKKVMRNNKEEEEQTVFETLQQYDFAGLEKGNPIKRFKTVFYGVPPIIKLSIFFYYLQCRKALVERYPAVFKKSEESGSSSPDFTSQYGWLALAHQLAGSGEFGTFAQLSKEPLHNILHHLSYKNDLKKEQDIKSIING